MKCFKSTVAMPNISYFIKLIFFKFCLFCRFLYKTLKIFCCSLFPQISSFITFMSKFASVFRFYCYKPLIIVLFLDSLRNCFPLFLGVSVRVFYHYVHFWSSHCLDLTSQGLKFHCSSARWQCWAYCVNFFKIFLHAQSLRASPNFFYSFKICHIWESISRQTCVYSAKLPLLVLALCFFWNW